MITNLTPHAITETQTGITYPPSGQVARVSVSYVDTGLTVGGAPVFVAVYSDVIGLPAPTAGETFIVSGMVMAAVTDRRDVVAPGDLVRDADGKPVGCRGWKGVS